MPERLKCKVPRYCKIHLPLPFYLRCRMVLTLKSACQDCHLMIRRDLVVRDQRTPTPTSTLTLHSTAPLDRLFAAFPSFVSIDSIEMLYCHNRHGMSWMLIFHNYAPSLNMVIPTSNLGTRIFDIFIRHNTGWAKLIGASLRCCL